jgi:hypothetical protein
VLVILNLGRVKTNLECVKPNLGRVKLNLERVKSNLERVIFDFGRVIFDFGRVKTDSGACHFGYRCLSFWIRMLVILDSGVCHFGYWMCKKENKKNPSKVSKGFWIIWLYRLTFYNF